MRTTYFLKGKKERKLAEFKSPNEIGIGHALPVPKDNPSTMKWV